MLVLWAILRCRLKKLSGADLADAELESFSQFRPVSSRFHSLLSFLS